MRKILTTIFMCSAMLQFTYTNAQRKADETYNFSEEIHNIAINDFTGSVIIRGKNKIESYNPDSKSMEWRVDHSNFIDKNAASLQKLDDISKTLGSGDLNNIIAQKKQEILFISNSPFISATIDNNDIIINSTNGEVVFDSSKFGKRIAQTEFIPFEKALLITAVDKESYTCSYYDLETKTIKWTSTLSNTESFTKQVMNVISFSKNNTGFKGSKLQTTEDKIYVTLNQYLYKLDKISGNIDWKTDFQITDFFLSQNEKNIITVMSSGSLFSTKQALNILNIDSNNKIWKDDIISKYITYLEDWGDRVLIATANSFNFYSYSDGKKIWKKDAKGDKIKKVIAIDNDYLYVSDQEVNLIDKNGNNLWKKFIEIADNKEDEVYYLGKIDNNRVLYLTDTYGNMIDYKSGKKIWKKNIQFDKKKPLVYTYSDVQKSFYVFNDKKVYKIDPTAQDGRDAFAKLKTLKEDKSVENIEAFDWGIALVGQSDVMGVGYDGEEKYHKTYKEPGEFGRRLLKSGSILGKGILDTYSSYKSGLANATVTITYRDSQGNTSSETQHLFNKNARDKMNKQADISSAVSNVINSTVLEKTKNRFNALKHDRDYAFVLNRTETLPEMVKVRKSDGKEVDRIQIDNNKPIYEVDQINYNMYYVYKNELRVYKKNN